MIEAQNNLLSMKIASYPHMKPEAQRRFHKDQHRLAYPKTYDETEISTSDLFQKLGDMRRG